MGYCPFAWKGKVPVSRNDDATNKGLIFIVSVYRHTGHGCQHNEFVAAQRNGSVIRKPCELHVAD